MPETPHLNVAMTFIGLCANLRNLRSVTTRSPHRTASFPLNAHHTCTYTFIACFRRSCIPLYEHSGILSFKEGEEEREDSLDAKKYVRKFDIKCGMTEHNSDTEHKVLRRELTSLVHSVTMASRKFMNLWSIVQCLLVLMSNERRNRFHNYKKRFTSTYLRSLLLRERRIKGRIIFVLPTTFNWFTKRKTARHW